MFRTAARLVELWRLQHHSHQCSHILVLWARVSSCTGAIAVFIISGHHVPCIARVATAEFSAKDLPRNTASGMIDAWRLSAVSCVWEWEPARIWMLPMELVWCWAHDVPASVARWKCAAPRRLCKRRQTAWCCIRHEARSICRRRVRHNRNSFYIASRLQRPAVYTGCGTASKTAFFWHDFIFCYDIFPPYLQGLYPIINYLELWRTSWSAFFV